MDINEIAKDTYYFSINNNLSGYITKRNAIKCFDQLVGSLTLAHSQNSQMSFMYGFFFVKFLFFTVV